MRDLHFDVATVNDLPAIVQLLCDDDVANKREQFTDPILPCYSLAFNAIQDDRNAHLITVKYQGRLIGVAQLNFLANLTYQGGVRAHIEGVRIDKDFRSQGVGSQLFKHLIELATQQGCHLVQLTTDKSRDDACRFYEQLGFISSHVGFKLHIKDIKSDG